MLTVDRLKEVLTYDPATGEFRWLISWRRARAGAVAGYFQDYVRIGIDGKNYRAHRLAFLYMTGSWPACKPDHRNRDRSDNRWENLRPATDAQNSMNKGLRSDNKTGVTGVKFRAKNGRWIASIGVEGRDIYLGSFGTKEGAIYARLAAASKYHGEFSCHDSL